MIAVLGAAAGVAASRVLLDSQERVLASIITGLLVVLTIGFVFNGLRPRAAAFGADPKAVCALVTDSPRTFGQELLSGLVSAYEANRDELAAKATSYERALIAFFLAPVSIGPLIATGALCGACRHIGKPALAFLRAYSPVSSSTV